MTLNQDFSANWWTKAHPLFIPVTEFVPLTIILMTKKFHLWFILGLTSTLTLIFLECQTLSLLAQETSKLSQPQQAVEALSASVKAERSHDFKSAIAKIDEATKAGLKQSIVHYKKGCWHFRLGNVVASLKEFDRYVELEPSRANSQWERGITCYYAKKYKAGAQQFVDYQTYHNNDVENAVWRYLCQAKVDGKEKARKAILPIKNDTRIPMMEIYELFRGESTPEKVLAELNAEKSTGPQAKHQQFDAHLYLALFYDSEGDLPAAKKHIDLAVKQFKRGDYMWAVAVEHQKHVDRQITKGEDEQSGEQPTPRAR